MEQTKRVTKAGPGSLLHLHRTIEQWLVGWHIVFLAMSVVVAVALQFDGDLTTDERLGVLGLIAVMIVWYLAIGWRRLGTESEPLGIVYIIGAWLLFLGTVPVTENGQVTFLLFVLIPQTWMFLKPRHAVILIVVGSVALGVVQTAVAGWATDALVGIMPWIALQVAVSLLLGMFITGIFNEAERRGTLIDELERTRAELASTEHDRGVLAERERLAHEIHDTLAQGFTSVLTLAQAVEVTIDRDPDLARQRLQLLEETARDNLAEARALVGGLQPVGLQQGPLVDAIGRVADRATRTGNGFSVTVDVEGTPRSLTTDEDVIVLRAAQEALSNIRRHAAATAVDVTLTYPGDHGIVLTVRDDGHGFDAASPRTGHGLAGMSARASQVGGTATVTSSNGSGTVVTVALPGLG